jgi:mRNA-degrading endonuclease RelE of RelBE toxin-antitoxin system
MKFTLTARALKDYSALPPLVQALVDKQLDRLLKDLRYPSLRAKKYDESRDIWQIRISRDYRCYFLIEGDTYVILSLCKHPK